MLNATISRGNARTPRELVAFGLLPGCVPAAWPQDGAGLHAAFSDGGVVKIVGFDEVAMVLTDKKFSKRYMDSLKITTSHPQMRTYADIYSRHRSGRLFFIRIGRF
jgi:hypothetical protein